eukprot:14444886-Alexandrium_andersonii.AAC.1
MNRAEDIRKETPASSPGKTAVKNEDEDEDMDDDSDQMSIRTLWHRFLDTFEASHKALVVKEIKANFDEDTVYGN